MNIEYRIITDAAGYADYTRRGRLRIDGSDSTSFLQALVTNDLNHLERHQGTYALYLTPQGRMIADLEVLRRTSGLWCSVSGTLVSTLAGRLDQLVFAEDARITDVSAQEAQICIVGRQAGPLLAAVFGLEPDVLQELPELAQVDVPGGFVYRSGGLYLPSYQIVVPAEERHDVIERIAATGIGPVSGGLLESLRIADARPAWGADLSETTIPLEAGLLDRAISTSKGCYVGQEVIIRILHRGGGRVARRLVQLTSSATTTPPDVGAVVQNESGVQIGALTSVALALEFHGWLALAYVTRDAAEIGRIVTVGPEGATARVTALAH
jgi:folate-binding protein YgfZ